MLSNLGSLYLVDQRDPEYKMKRITTLYCDCFYWKRCDFFVLLTPGLFPGAWKPGSGSHRLRLFNLFSLSLFVNKGLGCTVCCHYQLVSWKHLDMYSNDIFSKKCAETMAVKIISKTSNLISCLCHGLQDPPQTWTAWWQIWVLHKIVSWKVSVAQHCHLTLNLSFKNYNY